MLGRWGSAGEAAGDWGAVTDLVALWIAAAWLAGGPPDKRLMRSLQALHLQVRVLSSDLNRCSETGGELSSTLPQCLHQKIDICL